MDIYCFPFAEVEFSHFKKMMKGSITTKRNVSGLLVHVWFAENCFKKQVALMKLFAHMEEIDCVGDYMQWASRFGWSPIQ